MPTPPTPKPPLVAVVDDHDAFRKSICGLLKRHDFETCDFGSVAAFIESRSIHKIACLVLDVSMPGIDGVKLRDCLRHTNYEVPIIFCTGLDPEEFKLHERAFAVFRKPVDNDALIESVRSACALVRP